MDWTAAAQEDVSTMEFYFAVGTIEQRGRWDIQDWYAHSVPAN